jgi:hypothetical protein
LYPLIRYYVGRWFSRKYRGIINYGE